MAEPNTAAATALVTVEPKPVSLLRPIAPIAEILKARSETREAIVAALVPDRDIIRIPGTDKDALSKAGAESCCYIFGCTQRYRIIEQEIKHDFKFEIESKWVDAPEPPYAEKERLKAQKLGRNKKVGDGWQWQVPGAGAETVFGLYRYVVECTIFRHDGVEIGSCLASCSTRESKYSNRPSELDNTILKMAQKRAFVGAALHAFGLSDRLTQDMDEAVNDDDPVSVAARPTQAGAGRPNPGASNQRPAATSSKATTSTNGGPTRQGTNEGSGPNRAAPKYDTRESPKAMALRLYVQAQEAIESRDVEPLIAEWEARGARLNATMVFGEDGDAVKAGLAAFLRSKGLELAGQAIQHETPDEAAAYTAAVKWAQAALGKGAAR